MSSFRLCRRKDRKERTTERKEKVKTQREREMYSQNEDDDTRSRYQKISSDDGSQFNLKGVQDRRLLQSIRIHKEASWEKKKKKKAPRGKRNFTKRTGSFGDSWREPGGFQVSAPSSPDSIPRRASLSLSLFLYFPVYLSRFTFILRLIWRVRTQTGNFQIGRKFNTGKGNGGKSQGNGLGKAEEEEEEKNVLLVE